MGKALLSVGLDVGTTSTQMILSRLTAENRASAFGVPKMEITKREILYRSPVYFTPLASESLVDGPALRRLVEQEYAAAGITRETVDTGAVIVTGETSRKENARRVLEELSDFAGDFVVATAGPDLESILAARGAGAVERSKGRRVLHMDIGGGNSALQEALLLSEVCKKVTVVQNLADFTGEKKLAEALMAKDNVEVHFSTVVDGYRTENGKFTGLDLKKDSGESFSVACDGAFLAVGLEPQNGPFADLAELNSWGYFDSAEDCLTKTPGLFVAGDCRSKRIRQVVTASADGAIAAMAACRHLDT